MPYDTPGLAYDTPGILYDQGPLGIEDDGDAFILPTRSRAGPNRRDREEADLLALLAEV